MLPQLWPKLELDLEILKESNFGKVVKKLGKNKDKCEFLIRGRVGN